MTTHKFLLIFVAPFLTTCAVMMLNEYRLYRIGKLNYETFINSCAMLICGLMLFMTGQAIIGF